MKKYINQLIVLFLAAVVLQACSTTYVPEATKQVAIAQAKAAYIKNYNPGHGVKNVSYWFENEDYTAPQDSDSGLPEVYFYVQVHSNLGTDYNVVIMAQDKNLQWMYIGGGGGGVY